MSDILNIPLEDIERLTTNNAVRLFGNLII
jgi:Tat protein secretion system quality control protein TatD with DNase activity